MEKTFWLETYGCQMNVYDSKLITGILLNAGYKIAEKMEDANILLFNGCSVRGHAETRLLGRLRELKFLKRKRFPVVFGLLGCIAQRFKEEIFKEVGHLDFAAGPDSYNRLPDLIDIQFFNYYSKSYLSETRRTDFVLDVLTEYDGRCTKPEEGIHSYVAITRGCDQFCSYCVVPLVRGLQRSRKPDDILEEIKFLAQCGKRAITLLGQNVNTYSNGETKFSGLLEEVNKIDGVQRISFLTSHPKDFSLEVVEIIANSEKFYRHLHLPVQSGSNYILEKMKRGYTVEDYKNVIENVRKIIGEVSITTDVIVGFPGERERDFWETLELLRNIKFDSVYAFKFSPRAGTEAMNFSGQISDVVRNERLQILIQEQHKITQMKLFSNIGKLTKVIVEGKSKRNAKEWKGKTSENKDVVFFSNNAVPGEIINVKIEGVKGKTLVGKEE